MDRTMKPAACFRAQRVVATGEEDEERDPVLNVRMLGLAGILVRRSSCRDVTQDPASPPPPYQLRAIVEIARSEGSPRNTHLSTSSGLLKKSPSQNDEWAVAAGPLPRRVGSEMFRDRLIALWNGEDPTTSTLRIAYSRVPPQETLSLQIGLQGPCGSTIGVGACSLPVPAQLTERQKVVLDLPIRDSDESTEATSKRENGRLTVDNRDFLATYSIDPYGDAVLRVELELSNSSSSETPESQAFNTESIGHDAASETGEHNESLARDGPATSIHGSLVGKLGSDMASHQNANSVSVARKALCRIADPSSSMSLSREAPDASTRRQATVYEAFAADSCRITASRHQNPTTTTSQGNEKIQRDSDSCQHGSAVHENEGGEAETTQDIQPSPRLPRKLGFIIRRAAAMRRFKEINTMHQRQHTQKTKASMQCIDAEMEMRLLQDQNGAMAKAASRPTSIIRTFPCLLSKAEPSDSSRTRNGLNFGPNLRVAASSTEDFASTLSGLACPKTSGQAQRTHLVADANMDKDLQNPPPSPENTISAGEKARSCDELLRGGGPQSAAKVFGPESGDVEFSNSSSSSVASFDSLFSFESRDEVLHRMPASKAEGHGIHHSVATRPKQAVDTGSRTPKSTPLESVHSPNLATENFVFLPDPKQPSNPKKTMHTRVTVHSFSALRSFVQDEDVSFARRDNNCGQESMSQQKDISNPPKERAEVSSIGDEVSKTLSRALAVILTCGGTAVEEEQAGETKEAEGTGSLPQQLETVPSKVYESAEDYSLGGLTLTTHEMLVDIKRFKWKATKPASGPFFKFGPWHSRGIEMKREDSISTKVENYFDDYEGQDFMGTAASTDATASGGATQMNNNATVQEPHVAGISGQNQSMNNDPIVSSPESPKGMDETVKAGANLYRFEV